MSLNFKRHYPLILILVIVLVILVIAMGSQRIIAYTTVSASDNTSNGSTRSGENISNTIDLLDDSIVHSVQILISDEDYQNMITTYQQTGEKEYYKADVVIDGLLVEDVGIRLKGNSSLRTALGGMGGMGGRGFWGNSDETEGDNVDGERTAPEGFDPSNLPEDRNWPGRGVPGMPSDGEPLEGSGMPSDRQIPENLTEEQLQELQNQMGNLTEEQIQEFQEQMGNVPQGGFGGMGTTTDPSGEASIPLLIKFDEFTDGQSYQGLTQLSLRTYGSTYDAAILQEPLTNYVFDLVGLPSADTAYTSFQLNDETPKLYVLSEVIDEEYLAKNFTNADGILYKAELGSSLTYIDEDPSSYAESFSQETRENEADMAPFIRFMAFLTESDDATFENELDDYLDVDAFATYLAVNNLLVNTDSIIGMNNNFYLYYDDQAGRFTLLYWDGNESLGKMAGGSSSATYDLYMTSSRGMRSPGGGTNILLTRFIATDSFKALYEEKLQLVYEKAYLSGAMVDFVNAQSAVFHAFNGEDSLVSNDSYDQAVASVLSFIEQRMAYLQTTPLLGD